MQLFTSMRPPRTADELGYLQQCLKSWHAAGFEAVSLNGPKEIEAVRALNLGIASLPIGADGKPRIGAMLHAIRQSGARIAGLINSDCRIVNYPGLDWLHSGRALHGSIVVAWRIDVNAELKLTAQRGGFDAFFFDIEILPHDDRGFSIGELWWDHWFPLACEMNGAQLQTLAVPLLLHKDHPGSTRGFVESGLKFWAELQAWHGRGDMPASLLTRLPAIDRTPTYDEICQLTRATPRWLFECRPQKFPLMEASEIEAVLRLCSTAFLSYGQVETLRAEVEVLRGSTSWRMTEPLRRLVMAYHAIIGSARRHSQR